MKEVDIVHEAGPFWVARDTTAQGVACYAVYRNGEVCSAGDSAYSRSEDGLSIAIARADYLAKRALA